MMAVADMEQAEAWARVKEMEEALAAEWVEELVAEEEWEEIDEILNSFHSLKSSRL